MLLSFFSPQFSLLNLSVWILERLHLSYSARTFNYIFHFILFWDINITLFARGSTLSSAVHLLFRKQFNFFIFAIIFYYLEHFFFLMIVFKWSNSSSRDIFSLKLLLCILIWIIIRNTIFWTLLFFTWQFILAIVVCQHPWGYFNSS